MSECKKTIVFGSVAFPSRYAFKAVHALLEKGHKVIPMGIRDGTIAGLDIIKDRPRYEDVHTVTLYINWRNQVEWYDYLLELNPNRVIFNPGAENGELAAMLRDKNILAVEDCTLVMLAVGRY